MGTPITRAMFDRLYASADEEHRANLDAAVANGSIVVAEPPPGDNPDRIVRYLNRDARRGYTKQARRGRAR